MAEAHDRAQPTLRKSLSTFDGIMVLVGITIGAGIYSTPQIIAGHLESFDGILLLWLLAGAFVLVGGFIYAELGSRFPHTGGEYVYITRSLGPFAGFMFGWAQLFIIRTSAAAGLAIVAANYLGYFIDLSGIAHTLVALAIIAVLGALNTIGMHRASAYQNLSAIIKTGGLVLLVILGWILVQGQENLLGTRAAVSPDTSVFGHLTAAIMLVVFSHMGWDRVGYAAGEMKNPRRTIPLSMFAGIAIVIVVYISINVIYHRTLGMEGMRQSTIVASDIATRLIGPVGAGLVSAVVFVSATGSINGTMMTAPRVYYAMARDGLFLNWLDYVHPRFRTPSRAILLHCLWGSAILLLRSTFETIVAGMVFVILIFYAMTTIALFRFRRDNAGEADAYRMPFYPVLPGIYLLGIVALIVLRIATEWQNSMIDLAFVATGLPFALHRFRPGLRGQGSGGRG